MDQRVWQRSQAYSPTRRCPARTVLLRTFRQAWSWAGGVATWNWSAEPRSAVVASMRLLRWRARPPRTMETKDEPAYDGGSRTRVSSHDPLASVVGSSFDKVRDVVRHEWRATGVLRPVGRDEGDIDASQALHELGITAADPDALPDVLPASGVEGLPPLLEPHRSVSHYPQTMRYATNWDAKG
jgi:hypothetical protein